MYNSFALKTRGIYFVDTSSKEIYDRKPHGTATSQELRNYSAYQIDIVYVSLTAKPPFLTLFFRVCWPEIKDGSVCSTTVTLAGDLYLSVAVI